MLPCICSVAKLQCAKRASDAPWVRKIGNPSRQANLVMTSPSGRPLAVQTLGNGEGGLNINLYRTLLKAIDIPIYFCVFHFSLPSPDRKAFRKHAKKKKRFWTYIGHWEIFRVFSIDMKLYSLRSFLH